MGVEPGFPARNAVRYSVMPSPIGELLLTGDGDALTGVSFASNKRGQPRTAVPARWVRDDAALAAARTQLDEYFAGERVEFDLPLAPAGSPFQRRVWALLRAIGYGQTASYGDIARRLGQPNAARAVGLANGSNPIPVIVPCHRVIGADGSLTGFGGGLDRKRWLLAHERRVGETKWPGTRRSALVADLFDTA
jgi:methylated-DNA-[protein]-cysteine S-methyltransferase